MSEIVISELILPSGLKLSHVKNREFEKLNPFHESDFYQIANACRLNALTMIKAAGSGHVGSSLSAIDAILATRLFLFSQQINSSSSQANLFFSSKGHDVPAVYAVMHYFGEISDDDLFKLRKYDGLPGHPEITTPGIPTNTGSLGMGISKAKGFIYADRINRGSGSKVVTLLGDGELQEGQIWESLSSASRDNLFELIALIDGNKIQSDTWVEKTNPLGNLHLRFKGSGWNYEEINGHDFGELFDLFQKLKDITQPTAVYLNTKKASGVGFMEEFSANGTYYKYHSGSPSDIDYQLAVDELTSRIHDGLSPSAKIENSNRNPDYDLIPKARNKSLIQCWSELLVAEFGIRQNVVALDADLSYDTGTYEISKLYANRYIQCGIAEQDMVSMAGTLALKGLIPIVSSFASFLTMRAAEQIFNNSTQFGSKTIYCGFLAGLLPTAPGHSHQAVSDIGIIASFPNIEIFEPSCETELKLAFYYALESSTNSYLRIGSVDLPMPIKNSEVDIHSLNIRCEGSTYAILTSGPSMCVIAEEVAKNSDGRIAVYTYPAIQRKFKSSMLDMLSKYNRIFVIENYLPGNGLYRTLLDSLVGIENEFSVMRIGLNDLPANGDTLSVLQHHKLSPQDILKTIIESQ